MHFSLFDFLFIIGFHRYFFTHIPSLALSVIIDRENFATDMVLSNLLTNTSQNLPPRVNI